LSAGEFIKFYELKEKDVLTLYKDAEEKLVSYIHAGLLISMDAFDQHIWVSLQCIAF
jgi:hypothetical protein